jgi:hypothetical protein
VANILRKIIYNMNEMGLFWRMTPSSGLTLERRAGTKKDKSRISGVVCTNIKSTHKLPLWLIGKAKKPRALRGINLTALGIHWTGNKKAWMTTLVMIDWLHAFYSLFEASRSILLLMDNFSAHIAGVEIAPPPSNIRIQWLPPNATSLYQPLDQGIIANLKYHYRKRWLSYMIEQYEQLLNPLHTITIYHTIRWLSQSWFSGVEEATIYSCF